MNRLSKLALALAFSLAFALNSTAQVEFSVRVRPPAPVIVRPAPPSPRHVWVNEDWEWRDGRYIFVGGHWIAPERAGAIWRPGHWARRPSGWVWVPGHWAY